MAWRDSVRSTSGTHISGWRAGAPLCIPVNFNLMKRLDGNRYKVNTLRLVKRILNFLEALVVRDYSFTSTRSYNDLLKFYAGMIKTKGVHCKLFLNCRYNKRAYPMPILQSDLSYARNLSLVNLIAIICDKLTNPSPCFVPRCRLIRDLLQRFRAFGLICIALTANH